MTNPGPASVGHGRGRNHRRPVSLLLVEGDDRIRLSLAMALGDEGYAVTACETAERALAGFDRSTGEVVLVDLMLPGMDGFECLRQLHLSSDLPIVVVSTRQNTVPRAVRPGSDPSPALQSLSS